MKRTIALLFKRKGRTTLTEKEFVFSASMDLRWFPPKEAQKLLDMGLRRGLLSNAEGKLQPTFDVESVEVPLDFSPTAEVFKQGDDLFQRILDHLNHSSGIPRKEIVARINALQSRMGVYAEVAGLIVGLEMGLDMKPLYSAVEELIRQRRPTPAVG